MHDLIVLLLGFALGSLLTAFVITRRGARRVQSDPLALAPLAPKPQHTVQLFKEAVQQALDTLAHIDRTEPPQGPIAANIEANVAPRGSVPSSVIMEHARRIHECIEQFDSFSSSVLASNEQLRDTLVQVTTSSNTVDARWAAVPPLFNEAALLSTNVSDHLGALHDSGRSLSAHSDRLQNEWHESLDLLSHFGDALGLMQTCVTHVQDVANKAKLLSLNAAIVASQSQEHGQGFSVVAEQIKTVAQKTQEASGVMQQGLNAVILFRDKFAHLSTQLGKTLAVGQNDHTAVQHQVQLALEANSSLRRLLEQRAQDASHKDSTMTHLHETSTALISALMELNSALRLQSKDARRAQGWATQLISDLAVVGCVEGAGDAALEHRLHASNALCLQWQAHHTRLSVQIKEATSVLLSAHDQAAALQAHVPQAATIAFKS